MSFNRGWQFYPAEAKRGIGVNIPHTFNWQNKEGDCGGYRGICRYTKGFKRCELPQGDEHYLEFLGVASSAEVFLNGTRLGEHRGGYSSFRFNISDVLKEDNLLEVIVDNGVSDSVYPVSAGFAVYGGLFRAVNIIAVPRRRFDLDYYGSSGITVTAEISGNDARVRVEVYLDGDVDGCSLEYRIFNSQRRLILADSLPASECVADFVIKDVHLWKGREDPYLYTAEAILVGDGEELDAVKTRFGCRSFSVDPERGFILNGKEYPLRGVCRHSDRAGVGAALLAEHQREDAELIRELGATAVRLSGYQQDGYFYDLCDELGIVVWTEIPYVLEHTERGRDNTVVQLSELIIQNYNHPSVFFWGLSSELSVAQVNSPDLVENHRILNNLAHLLDKTRSTVVAVTSSCSPDEKYVSIPDLVTYNHYFGARNGDVSAYGPWLDSFHTRNPRVPIGLGEYGCEAMERHTSSPECGDFSEEYQAYYHEQLIEQIKSRSYLFATYACSMFDFCTDTGEVSRMGLVSFDRRYKKDAFYAYKAWLSKEPFVHICSKRYVERAEPVTVIRVYSNMPAVELFVNGESLGVLERDDHFFRFAVKNEGSSRIFAVAGECRDEARIRKVD